MKLRHIKSLTKSRTPPVWMQEAITAGCAVWCRANNGGPFDDHTWITPLFFDDSQPYIDIDGNRYQWAGPIEDEEVLREADTK